MSLHLPDGSVHEAERCNRCGAPAGTPLDPPLTVAELDHDDAHGEAGRAFAAAGARLADYAAPVGDGATTTRWRVEVDGHGDIVDGRCLPCRLGATVEIDLRRDLSPYQQLALFVLAGAWQDADVDGDTDERVNMPVIDAVGADVAQRLARGVLALGINPGAQVHDQDCLTLAVHPSAGCTCRHGATTLYELAGVDLALAAAEAAIATMADNGTAGL